MVIFLELHWTPGNILQAEDRAHRIGQKNNVNITYLVSKGDSIDMKIWDMLGRKQQFLGLALNGTKQEKEKIDTIEHDKEKSHGSTGEEELQLFFATEGVGNNNNLHQP